MQFLLLLSLFQNSMDKTVVRGGDKKRLGELVC